MEKPQKRWYLKPKYFVPIIVAIIAFVGTVIRDLISNHNTAETVNSEVQTHYNSSGKGSQQTNIGKFTNIRTRFH